MSVLLASWKCMWARDGLDYAGAAQGQLDFLLEEVSRMEDRAISHLVDEVQLWVRAWFSLFLFFVWLCSRADDPSAGRDRANPYTWSRPSSPTTGSYSKTRACSTRRTTRLSYIGLI